MQSNALIALAVLLLLVLAVALLRWPQEFQRWILMKQKTWRGLAAWNPWQRYMESAEYLLGLRFVGCVCVTMAAILIWVIVRRIN